MWDLQSTWLVFPNRKPVHPPLLGEHTVDVLAELGYSRDEVSELEGQGVISLQKS